MVLRTLKDAPLAHKRILIRVDFNVPIHNGVVTDDTRIRASLPTLNHVLSIPGTRLIVMSHLGRPKGTRDPNFTLKPVVPVLSSLLGVPVKFVDECIGPRVTKMAEQLHTGEVLMIENVRFHSEENANSTPFASQLAALGDVYVNDAFGSAHRAHASTEGVAHILPSYAGMLIEREIRFLKPILEGPKRPLMAIIGGSKISSKIEVLESLLTKVDILVIGGAMAYTFLKAQGHSVGSSLIEEEHIATAKNLLQQFSAHNHLKVIFASDHVAASSFDQNAAPQIINNIDIPDELCGMDIGPDTIAKISSEIAQCQTIVWNGPLGVFEFPAFAHGTLEIAQKIASSNAISIVGGGDSIAALNNFGLANSITHVSTGGGASLEFLEGKKLPGISVLYDQ